MISMGFVLRLTSLLRRSIMFVVLKEIHSSSGQIKNVRHAYIEFSKHLTADGRSRCHLSLKMSRNSITFSFEEA